MVAVLVLATFVIFVLVDFYMQRRQPQPGQVVKQPQEAEQSHFPLNVVGGFKLPAHLSYHPGHAWVLKEGRQLARVGLDDFAARLLGSVDRIELPARGRWLRQGEKAWTLARGNHRFEMLSPIEGEVVDVNLDALNDPAVVLKDPYGAGWLVAVSAPAVDANMKNLIRGRLGELWLEDSVATLHDRVRGERGVHLQDGGRAVADILEQIPEARWEALVRELLLS